ncbi:hypothetical protein KAU11_04550, partial [Candidatus Babeliales bacterium]|nr:hypothetical protein [Candidatus Babeliales bacterium]
GEPFVIGALTLSSLMGGKGAAVATGVGAGFAASVGAKIAMSALPVANTVIATGSAAYAAYRVGKVVFKLGRKIYKHFCSKNQKDKPKKDIVEVLDPDWGKYKKVDHGINWKLNEPDEAINRALDVNDNVELDTEFLAETETSFEMPSYKKSNGMCSACKIVGDISPDKAVNLSAVKTAKHCLSQDCKGAKKYLAFCDFLKLSQSISSSSHAQNCAFLFPLAISEVGNSDITQNNLTSFERHVLLNELWQIAQEEDIAGTLIDAALTFGPPIKIPKIKCPTFITTVVTKSKFIRDLIDRLNKLSKFCREFYKTPDFADCTFGAVAKKATKKTSKSCGKKLLQRTKSFKNAFKKRKLPRKERRGLKQKSRQKTCSKKTVKKLKKKKVAKAQQQTAKNITTWETKETGCKKCIARFMAENAKRAIKPAIADLKKYKFKETFSAQLRDKDSKKWEHVIKPDKHGFKKLEISLDQKAEAIERTTKEACDVGILNKDGVQRIGKFFKELNLYLFVEGNMINNVFNIGSSWLR